MPKGAWRLIWSRPRRVLFGSIEDTSILLRETIATHSPLLRVDECTLLRHEGVVHAIVRGTRCFLNRNTWYRGWFHLNHRFVHWQHFHSAFGRFVLTRTRIIIRYWNGILLRSFSHCVFIKSGFRRSYIKVRMTACTVIARSRHFGFIRLIIEFTRWDQIVLGLSGDAKGGIILLFFEKQSVLRICPCFIKSWEVPAAILLKVIDTSTSNWCWLQGSTTKFTLCIHILRFDRIERALDQIAWGSRRLQLLPIILDEHLLRPCWLTKFSHLLL